jgi:DnaJ-class molecular chaperone
MRCTRGALTGGNEMTKTKKCGRCNGTGLVFTDRTCFGCNGTGVIVADKFLRVLGTGGKFFGVTGPARNAKVTKEVIRAATEAKLTADLEAGCKVVEITEEQARVFFARYGVRTQVAA